MKWVDRCRQGFTVLQQLRQPGRSCGRSHERCFSAFGPGPATEVCVKVEEAVRTPIRPLSINEILTLHTGALPFHGQVDGADRGGSSTHDFDHCGARSREFSLLQSANWARKEIPLRLAHRLYDFSRLPFIVVSNEHIYEVYQMYCDAFEKLDNFGEIRSLEDEDSFTQQLRQIVAIHANVVALMQRGISVLRQVHPDISLDGFLDRLFGTRIGNRILAESHLALHDHTDWFEIGGNKKSNPQLGSIQRHCRPADIIEDVASKVQQVAMYTYGCAPQVSVIGDLDLTFPYIPEHLRSICFEILKNSIRATIEYHRESCQTFPLVTVGIHRGQTQVVIKVTDQGGGIADEVNDYIWQYGFSTVAPLESKASLQVAPATSRADQAKPLNPPRPLAAPDQKQMAGYGFGLPLSRLYTRYFGGDLDIKFMSGYGSDSYIFLPLLGNQKESEEILNHGIHSSKT